MYHISVPFSCKFFYIMIIYEKDWCWCQVVWAVFVLHTIYVVPIGHQHSSGISDWSLYYLPKKKKKMNDVLWYYSGLQILFIVTLSMFFFSFCKYNLRHFYERKTKILENDFLVQLLRHAVSVAASVFVSTHRQLLRDYANLNHSKSDKENEQLPINWLFEAL